jgi:septum formation protein
MMDWLKKWNIILGSGSPRRAELLKLAGFEFTVIPSNIDESIPEQLESHKAAVYIAGKKARSLKGALKENDLLITADSVVILENKILGKPSDEKEARNILSLLSGEKHQVITGVCLMSIHKELLFDSRSTVFMERLTEQEIEHYIHHYKPFDKAGSYGIQEWIGINRIKRIEGSYTNIMGLPTATLYDKIKSF